MMNAHRIGLGMALPVGLGTRAWCAGLIAALVALAVLTGPAARAWPLGRCDVCGQEATVALVRARFAPLMALPLGGARFEDASPAWLGGASPAAFGMPRGMLQVVGVAATRGLVIAELGSADAGGMFVVPVSGGAAGAPVRIAEEARREVEVGFDAREARMVFVSPRGVVVATLAATAAEAQPARVVVPMSPASASGSGGAGAVRERLERPRFIDDRYVVYERSRSPARGGADVSTVEIVAADGSEPPRVLVPAKAGGQGRVPVAFDPEHLLLYRDGVLQAVEHGALRSLAPHFEGAVVTPGAPTFVDRPVAATGVWLTLGPGGEKGRRALGRIDGSLNLERVTAPRPMYLEPLVAPGGARVAVSLAGADGAWALHVVGGGRGAVEDRVVSAPGARPIWPVAWDPSGRYVAGCRGGEVVVADTTRTGDEALRVVAAEGTTGVPYCSVRAVVMTGRGPMVVYEARAGDGTRPVLVPAGEVRDAGGHRMPVSGGSAVHLPEGLSVVGAVGGALVVQSVAAPAKLVVTRGGRTTDLVPWQREGIATAYMARERNGSGVVVYRLVGDSRWFVVPVGFGAGVVPRVWADGDGERARRDGTGREPQLIGFTRGWGVFADGARVIGYRLAGGDVGRPVVLMEDAERPVVDAVRGRIVVRHGRLSGAPALVSVAIEPAGASGVVGPTTVVLAGRVGAFDVDQASGRVVALGAAALVLAANDGSEAERPEVRALGPAIARRGSPSTQLMLADDPGGPVDLVALQDGTVAVAVRGPDLHMNSLPPVHWVWVPINGPIAGRRGGRADGAWPTIAAPARCVPTADGCADGALGEPSSDGGETVWLLRSVRTR